MLREAIPSVRCSFDHGLSSSWPESGFTHTNSTMSANNAWQSVPFSGWTTADTAEDYGVWEQQVNVDDYGPGNYGVVYLRAFDADAGEPPPTSQPETNTFRYYLPTDAGAAPEKPFVSHYVRYVSGDNPPTVGNPSVFQMTVVVTNPTGAIGDITFSQPSNLTIINVPGGDVVYGGGATISAGTLVSQPTVGFGGDVRWSPGTLSPGDSELLTYQITVTPSAAGILNVTGAAGSGNGTRASFVDETGNTAQSRATFDFGELCELQVGTSLLTHAVISHFDVFRDAGRIVVRFKTRSEAGTAGFHLERFDARTGRWTRVNEKLVTGLLDAPQGGTYSVVDTDAFLGEEELTYALFEVDRRGKKKRLGVYTRSVNAAPPSTIRGKIRTRTARPSAMKPTGRRRKATATRRGRGAARKRSEIVKITVDQEGATYVTAESIAEALALDVPFVRSRIRRYLFDLRNRGKRVSWQANGDGSGLYFFAEGIDSTYTAENVYWLHEGKGKRIRSIKGRLPGGGGRQSFKARSHFEEDLFATLVLPVNAQSDY